MINTYFGSGTLDSAAAFVVALLIGLGFGISLEQAGFGSSRRLAGVFYFRDMAVLKVLFTAVITGMIGLSYLVGSGILPAEQVFFLPTVYGAQIAGGLLFGFGFVMSGWCPGTAAVGLASGKLDALVFLLGAAGGSVLFNETYPWIAPLTATGDRGVQFAWQNLGVSQPAFALAFTLIAILCFWGAEYIERARLPQPPAAAQTAGGRYLNGAFLRSFSVALLVLVIPLFVLGGAGFGTVPIESDTSAAAHTATGSAAPVAVTGATPANILTTIAEGADHVEPEDLADRVMQGDPGWLLIDIRTPEEFARFHIRGAVNVALPELPEYLRTAQNGRRAVLYSNGMTHPAQARDELTRAGFGNLYLLTDGLEGFIKRCLRPVALRAGPLAPDSAGKINAWRSYFHGQGTPAVSPAAAAEHSQDVPSLVEPEWLEKNLARQDLRVIDVRPQPQYNSGHIPGAVCFQPESVRGVVGGISSMLLPADMLARQFGLMGVTPQTTVVIVPEEKLHDATLIAIALERLGHPRTAVLSGGFARWATEQGPTDTAIPMVREAHYPVPGTPDAFSVDAEYVLHRIRQKDATIIDVRPAENFTGAKSDEPRAGHLPGAINRPFTEDVAKTGQVTQFKPLAELATAYTRLIPSKDAPVVLHCRTGHQASQTYFVLRHLLGYRNVKWYDAGWTEWSARPELPIEAHVGAAPPGTGSAPAADRK